MAISDTEWHEFSERMLATQEKQISQLVELRFAVEIVRDLKHDFYGNGKPGTKADVEKLKEADARRSRLEWIIVSAAIVSLIGGLFTVGGLAAKERARIIEPPQLVHP